MSRGKRYAQGRARVCVCVHGCTQARGGQRTSTCTPCRCRTGRHAARTRSSCPCHADHPRSAACPSSAWLALNGVSYTQICACSRRPRQRCTLGVPLLRFMGQNGGRSAGTPTAHPSTPGGLGNRDVRLSLSQSQSRYCLSAQPAKAFGRTVGSSVVVVRSSPFPDQLITLALGCWGARRAAAGSRDSPVNSPPVQAPCWLAGRRRLQIDVEQ